MTTHWQTRIGALLLLLCGGCGGEREATSASVPTQPARDSGQPLRNGENTFGPITYRVPEGWEEQPARMAEGRVLFAPTSAEWQEIGFRPNIGIRIREHPGTDIDGYEQQVRQLLSESAAKLDRLSGAEIRRRDPEIGKKIRLREKGDFTVRQADVGGHRVLVSRFDGVHTLPTGSLASRTLGIQVLGKKVLYSLSFTFPREHAADFEPVWGTFRESLSFDSTGLEATE